MNPIDQARRYLDKQPSAISGSAGHNQTFAVACALVHGFALTRADALSLLHEYNTRCQPPWSERELEHKVDDAARATHDKPRGHMLRAHAKHSTYQKPMPTQPPVTLKSEPKKIQFEPVDKLPDPIPDGTRELLKSVFQPGEGIRICPAKLNDDNKEIPENEGIVLSREEWLRKLDAVKGNPNGIFTSSKKTGIYVSVNPMRQGGKGDADVTSYRHVLIEFDNISPEEQLSIYQNSRIPCAAIIHSGGKSVHAWVRVDAKDKAEYDERRLQLYSYFESAGLQIDAKNKNPSRFSRLPGCIRFSKRQELLALNVGAESFSQWLISVNADGLGEVFTPQKLREWKVESDENTLVGKRWLNKGGSVILSAPSGVGKSSLEMQKAVGWALGRPVFGLAPKRPLKSLIVQAENDEGDLAEAFAGSLGYYGLLDSAGEADIFNQAEAFELLDANLVIVTLTTHVGEDCIEALRRLVDKYKPDITWMDPAAAFVGDDLSRQTTIASFFRKGLNSISKATGTAWYIINHTTKPPTDSKAKSHWQSTDFQYSGAGSYDLPGWARGVMVLRQVSEHVFELKLAKRGKRAGATHPSGEPTTSIWIQHSDKGIAWIQVDPPAEPERKPGKSGKPNDVEQVAVMHLEGFYAACLVDGEGKNAIARRLESYLATAESKDISSSTCKRVIERMVSMGKLSKGADSLYRKGSNA